MKIRPTNDRVLVRPDPEATTSKGGIVLVSTPKDGTPLTGVVVDVGPKVQDGDLKLEICVLYPRFGGQEITLDGEKFILIPEGELLGVLS